MSFLQTVYIYIYVCVYIYMYIYHVLNLDLILSWSRGYGTFDLQSSNHVLEHICRYSLMWRFHCTMRTRVSNKIFERNVSYTKIY